MNQEPSDFDCNYPTLYTTLPKNIKGFFHISEELHSTEILEMKQKLPPRGQREFDVNKKGFSQMVFNPYGPSQLFHFIPMNLSKGPRLIYIS